MIKPILALLVISCVISCATQPENKEVGKPISYNDSVGAVFAAIDKKIQLQSPFVFPKPIGRVNDFDNLISPATNLRIATALKAHENKTTNQIAVVTVADTGPYESDLDVYTYHLAGEWGVGQKGKNNGVVVAVSNRLHKMRITVGKGLEDVLTDAECQRIIDDLMIPEFKKGNYEGGIEKGLLEIIRILEK